MQAGVALGLGVGVASGAEDARTPAERAGASASHSLWQRTPKELWREVDTDPCHFVEGPYTLNGGRFQIEWGLATWAREETRTAGALTERREEAGFSAVIVRAGLTPSLELSVTHDGWVHVRTTDVATATSEVVRGWQDAAVGLKYNVWGNDGGRTALGVVAGQTFATGARDVTAGEAETSASMVFAATLAKGEAWELAAGTQVRRRHSASSEATDFSQSLRFCRELSAPRSVAVEANASRSAGDGDHAWTGLGAVMLTWAREDWEVEVGLVAGASRGRSLGGGFLKLSRWY